MIKFITNEGEKNIEDIEVGDKVLAKDENNPDGELAYKEVTDLFFNERDDIIKLYVGEQIIETTDNHPFWVEGKGWVFADELQVGDKLQKADGSSLTIDKVEFVKLDEPVMVYNFAVADYHTYYVTGIGIWVHNTNTDACNWKSVKQFGHTFSTHGAGAKNTKSLTDRARSTGNNQGQWLDNQKAAEFIASKGEIKEATTFNLPAGMGQVITPSGQIVPATKVIIVPSATGVKTAYPMP